MAKNGRKKAIWHLQILETVSITYLNEYFRFLVNAEGIINSVESTLEKNCPIHKWKVFGKLGNLKADMFEECTISDILGFQYLFSQGLQELVILVVLGLASGMLLPRNMNVSRYFYEGLHTTKVSKSADLLDSPAFGLRSLDFQTLLVLEPLQKLLLPFIDRSSVLLQPFSYLENANICRNKGFLQKSLL